MPDDVVVNEPEESTERYIVPAPDLHAEPEASLKPLTFERIAPVEPNAIPTDVAMHALIDALRAADTGN
jgi:hypothetical protein